MLTRRAAQARYSRTGQTVTNRSEPESKLNAKSKLDAKSDDKKNSPEAAQNKIKSHVKSTTRFEPKPKPCNNSTPNQQNTYLKLKIVPKLKVHRFLNLLLSNPNLSLLVNQYHL